jgi:hypothetical protein
LGSRAGNAELNDNGGMIRRDGLAVYLPITVLAGTFFVTVAYFSDSAESWGREGRWIPGFVQTYGLALAGGFVMQAVFAVLLRWSTRVTRLNGPLHWIAAGALLGVILPWAFARLGYLLERMRFPADLQQPKFILNFPLMGAMMYEVQAVWVLAAVGAATGGTAHVVMRLLARRRRAG